MVMTTEEMLSSQAPSQEPFGFNSTHNPYGPYRDDIDNNIQDITNDTLRALTSNLYASAVAQNLTRLNTSECIKSYATPFPQRQGNLILVANDSTNTPYVAAYDSLFAIDNEGFGCPADPFNWICNQILLQDPRSCDQRPTCLQTVSTIDPDDWRPFKGNKIEYCLSQTIEEKCNLALNEPIIGVVLVFNLVKCILLVWTILLLGKEHSNLMTIGDSIASFIRSPDETTRDMCLMSRDDLKQWKNSSPTPKPLVTARRRWNSAASKSRWTCLVLL